MAMRATISAMPRSLLLDALVFTTPSPAKIQVPRRDIESDFLIRDEPLAAV
jgi:hypothetical protein